MPKYRKRPVVIEAFQYDGDLINSKGEWYVPDWAVTAKKSGIIYFKDAGDMYIETLEGDMKTDVGDYIIQGIKGELYPCKPDIFEQTYEAVE